MSYVRFIESRKTGQQHIFISVLNLYEYINIMGNLIINFQLIWNLYSVTRCIGDHQNYKTMNIFEKLDVMKPPKLRAHRLCKEYQNAETRDDSCQFLIRPQKYRGPLLQIIRGKKAGDVSPVVELSARDLATCGCGYHYHICHPLVGWGGPQP